MAIHLVSQPFFILGSAQPLVELRGRMIARQYVPDQAARASGLHLRSIETVLVSAESAHPCVLTTILKGSHLFKNACLPSPSVLSFGR